MTVSSLISLKCSPCSTYVTLRWWHHSSGILVYVWLIASVSDETFRRAQSAVCILPLCSVVLFPSCPGMSALVSRELLEGLVSLRQPLLLTNPDTSLPVCDLKPKPFWLFSSLSHSTLSLNFRELASVKKKTSCYAVVCEEECFSHFGPPEWSACGSYFRQRSPDPWSSPKGYSSMAINTRLLF